ncbi:Crp/Fnr family transcriptional regulator [Burkholderia sp. 22PA0099]|uniref:Crp/Fnr family transcriptional regulator n=1 Tax=Burkholderia sp. 22PA0099 TaxID=3237372 RepID=UPI0039C05998
MPLPPRLTDNYLLAALSEDERKDIAPHLSLVELPLGTLLHESGSRQSYAYFPTTAIMSLLYVMEDGSSAEIAIAGKEGMIGVSLFMGVDTTPSRAIVQSAGRAYRMDARLFGQAFQRGGMLQQMLLRYTHALITQMAQTAVCNRHHSIDQQLCRWLLMSLDRLPSNQLRMTQELIANMLGVRRSGVTGAALKLQDAGLIRYNYGHIEVLDRPGLENRVCECYRVVKREYDKLRLDPNTQ